MSLPKRKYYSLKKAAYHLKCEVDDLLHYASIGMLQLCVYIRADSREWSTSALVISKWTEELTQDVALEHLDKLLYVTELNSVSENVSGYLDGKAPELITSKGFWAISTNEINTPVFEKTGKAVLTEVLMPREMLSSFEKKPLEYVEGYTPGSIIFTEDFLSVSTDDFFITEHEFEILKKGGRSLFHDYLHDGKINITPLVSRPSRKTINTQAKFIKALLHILYNNKDLTNNPRKYIENENSEIYNDFKIRNLKLPSGKVTVDWFRDVDLDFDDE